MALVPWQDAIKDPTELKVFRSLASPDWDWRSLDGLQSETGLDPTEILHVIYKYPEYIRSGQSNSKGAVFQLKDRSPSGNSLKEKAIDSFTFSRARKLK